MPYTESFNLVFYGSIPGRPAICNGDKMNINYSQIQISFNYAVKFIPITMFLTIVPLMIGIILGGIVAVVRVFRIKLLSNILDISITVLKGIPTILIILVCSLYVTNAFNDFAAAMNWSIRSKDIDVIYIALFALSISATVMISETIRGALLSIEQSQYDAAYSVGLTKFQTFQRIILPQVFLVVIPTLSGNLIGLLKGSSIAYVIGVSEILNSSLRMATATYAFLEAYIAAALIYWALGILIETIGRLLEKKISCYRRNLS